MRQFDLRCQFLQDLSPPYLMYPLFHGRILGADIALELIFESIIWPACKGTCCGTVFSFFVLLLLTYLKHLTKGKPQLMPNKKEHFLTGVFYKICPPGYYICQNHLKINARYIYFNEFCHFHGGESLAIYLLILKKLHISIYFKISPCAHEISTKASFMWVKRMFPPCPFNMLSVKFCMLPLGPSTCW